MFPCPITRLAFEITERTFFAASSDDVGTIHQVKLFRRRPETANIEAIGGGGLGEAIRIDTYPKSTFAVG